ncbi:MAG: LURP-one-related family protein [Erysipelothrix sp.]|nr:LURP-one-related family protein [Erysipelothrix sp.]
MKLYIKQKVFSFNDKFTVKDETGADRYFVEGEIFTLGKKLHVYDINQTERIYLQQKLWSFLPRFFVFVDGLQVAEIVREFTFLKPKYSILGLNWEVIGNFWAHDYEILNQGHVVVTIKKEWLTWGDTYVLDILDQRDELNALAIVLAIDAVMSQQRSSANSSSR